ncbi:hypothetical protein PCASD_24188 [Puccinia coronata f. sp. avenae]|uniref:Uncharacterized protein n=1 Tax=Puccinia coronata f. sp. avenae TaxID=200324 RepID=A0A2N5S6Z6_9BASI|nr:hypothetical protein PCASD_24188 [Puccinia coronata f. sp. avenae]
MTVFNLSSAALVNARRASRAVWRELVSPKKSDSLTLQELAFLAGVIPNLIYSVFWAIHLAIIVVATI